MRTFTEITISREELHRRVWERPMRELAAELGISDVGLKKLCRRNGIPTPPQGYHLMAQGPDKQRLSLSLPPAAQGQRMQLTFRVTNEAVAEAQARANIQAREALSQPSPALTTEEKRSIESVLMELRGMVDRRKTDRRGMIVVPSSGYPARVSPQAFDRAFRILDSLFTRFVPLGAKPSAAVNEHRVPIAGFEFHGFEFHFAIEETSKRIEVPPPAPKRSRSVRPVLGYFREWRMEPTGRLTLQAWGPASGGHTRLQDRADRIEDRLDELAEWVFSQSALAREEARIESERWNRAVAYLQDKDKPRLEAEFQAQRRRQLESEARQWRRAQALRDYIAAVEQAEPHTASGRVSDFVAWLSWAKAHADSLDPTVRGDACTVPAYPAPRRYDRIPHIFLDYDDPAEAARALEKEPWRNY